MALGAIGCGALAVGEEVRKQDATMWTRFTWGFAWADLGAASTSRTLLRGPLAGREARRQENATTRAVFWRVRRGIFDL